MQRYEGGERTRYFRDDDGTSLKDMVEAERRGGARGMDDHYADNVARAGRKFKATSAEDEYDFDRTPQAS